MVFPYWEYSPRRLNGGKYAVNRRTCDEPTVIFFHQPFDKDKGQYIDAKNVVIEFPNKESLHIFVGRLRAMSQRRHHADTYEFPIVTMPKTRYRSRGCTCRYGRLLRLRGRIAVTMQEI